MTVYSKRLSEEYVKNRDKHTATDAEVFTHLATIGLKNKRILDFGCGDGRYSFEFLRRGAKSVVGIDVSPRMVELAKERLSQSDVGNVDFFEADGENLPFAEGSFDVVFSNFVLHHFVDTTKPLSEIFRVLDTNGYFIATFSSFDIAQEETSLVGTEVPLILGEGDEVTKVWDILKSRNEIENTLKEIGFRIELYQHINNPHVHIDPSYPHLANVNERTILAIAQKM